MNSEGSGESVQLYRLAKLFVAQAYESMKTNLQAYIHMYILSFKVYKYFV